MVNKDFLPTICTCKMHSLMLIVNMFLILTDTLQALHNRVKFETYHWVIMPVYSDTTSCNCKDLPGLKAFKFQGNIFRAFKNFPKCMRSLQNAENS